MNDIEASISICPLIAPVRALNGGNALKIQKLLTTVLCTLALAACGGGDDGDSSEPGGGGSGGGGNGGGTSAEATHSYFSVDFTDFQTPRSVVIDHEKASGTVTLGNDTISYTANGEGEVSASGYTVLGQMDESDGAVMVCKNTSSTSTQSRHFILPANAERVTDLNVLKNKSFERFENCEQSGSYSFSTDGSLSWVDGDGESDSGTELPATVAEWLSDGGHGWTDEGESGRDYAKLYREPGSNTLFIVDLMTTEGNRELAVAVESQPR